jgi:hypothetical protein
MHAVVAVPPIQDFYFTPHRFSSLGARILCTLLSNAGLKVSFINFPLHRKKGKAISLPQGLEYLNRHIIAGETGKLSFFTRYQRFGPSIEECAKAITDRGPDLCCISCFAFAYGLQTIELAQGIKRLRPYLPIIVGGAGPSAYPDFFLKDPAIDFVVTGEAEISIVPLIKALASGSNSFEQIPNLYWKSSSAIHASPIKKWTDQKDIAVEFSEPQRGKNAIYLSTSLTRGCSKACRFCSNFITHGKTFRMAPFTTIQQAIDAIILPKSDAPSTLSINFEDDNLVESFELWFQAIEYLKEKFGRVSLLCENGVDYALLSVSMAQRLIQAGMAKFNISLGSIDTAILNNERRFVELDHYRTIVKTIARNNIPSITYFICGLKNDTKESIANTLTFLYSQPTTIGISLYYAVPGIGNFEELNRFDTNPPYYCSGSSAFPWNGSLSTATMITAFRLSRLCNMLKQNDHSCLEKEILGKIFMERKLYTFIKSPEGVKILPIENTDEELVEMFFNKISQPASA